MNLLAKGIAVAVLHILIMLSLGGKLLYDRANRPRVWVRTGSVDPDLPVRGRYLTLNLQVQAFVPAKPSDAPSNQYVSQEYVELAVENGQLVAHKTDRPSELYVTTWRRRSSQPTGEAALLMPAVDFFLPEHADFPNIKQGEELWAEVTVPRKGPPRPIQLALKRGTEWKPLSYK